MSSHSVEIKVTGFFLTPNINCKSWLCVFIVKLAAMQIRYNAQQEIT